MQIERDFLVFLPSSLQGSMSVVQSVGLAEMVEQKNNE
jgi:hypothetical protein